MRIRRSLVNVEVADGECNLKCAGDASKTCGARGGGLRFVSSSVLNNWSEAPIVNAIPDFPFLEGSRAIVGSRQLQAISGLLRALIGGTRISCSVKHQPLDDGPLGALQISGQNIHPTMAA